jgi:hypothetical protein
LIYNIPTVGVSESLNGLPFQYFSGMMRAIVRPTEINDAEKLMTIAGLSLSPAIVTPDAASLTGTPGTCT